MNFTECWHPFCRLVRGANVLLAARVSLARSADDLEVALKARREVFGAAKDAHLDHYNSHADEQLGNPQAETSEKPLTSRTQ